MASCDAHSRSPWDFAMHAGSVGRLCFLSQQPLNLSAFCLSPSREIGQRLLIRRRIEPKNATTVLDFFGDEILERRHLKGLIRDLDGKMRRDHDDAIAVAEDDVA